MQQAILEAPATSFKINPKYYDAIQRPTYDEERALNESIIVNGQLIPIVANSNMVVLDGHSRFNTLNNLGKTIKYIIQDFSNEEDEHRFVVESNIMRRNLNPFQKIEAMYHFIKKEREKKRMSVKSVNSIYAILTAIKAGKKTSREIATEAGMEINYVAHMLTDLTNDYSVSRVSKTVKNGGHGKMTIYEYTLLPKAEELLAKDLRWKSKVTISRSIGVSKTTMELGLYLIENANDDVLNKLRKGALHINTAYQMISQKVVDRRDPKKLIRKPHLKCPECSHVGENDTFKRINPKTLRQYQ